MKISNKILYSALISISLLVIMSPKNLKADIRTLQIKLRS